MSVRRFESIRTRLAVTFVLIVLLPMAVIGLVVAISGTEGAQAQLNNQLELAASIKQGAIQTWATGLERELVEVAARLVRDGNDTLRTDGPSARGRLQARLVGAPGPAVRFRELMLWDPSGRPLLSTRTRGSDRLPPLAAGTHAALIGSMVVDGRLEVLAYHSIQDDHGKLLATLGGIVKAGELQEILADRQGLGETGTAFLLDREGRLLLTHAGVREGTILPGDWSTQWKGTREGRGHHGVPVNEVHTWLPNLQLHLITEQDLAESTRSILVLLAVYTGVALAAVLIALFLALSTTHRIATPLSDLSETADEIAAGNLGVRADEDRRDEIGALARSFNAMADHLQRTVAGLKASEENYRSIFENALEGVFQSTLTGRFLKANPATACILGYDTPGELLAQDLDIPRDVYVDAGDRTRMLDGLLRHGEYKNLEMQVHQKDRQRIWVSLSTRLVRDSSGAPLYIEGMLIDITERRMHEEERRRHREHLEDLVDERTFNLTEANQRLQLEVAERRKAEIALRDSEAKLEEFNRSLEVRIETSVVELRQKDKLLIQQSRQAAMGEMIGNIAHQWRQPLNTLGLLLSNLEDAHRFGDLDPPMFTRTIEEGHRLIQKMSSTINDFRNFFLPDKGKSEFSALEQIRETTALVDASFRNHHIALELEAPGDVQLFGFPNEYSQVLLNILGNAKQAIEASNSSAGRVTIQLSKAGDCGCVKVRDNGGGIPVDILDRIFEPYFSTKEMGTGIGLYMSKQIIERNMHGSLQAANVEDGAEFVILTPLARRIP